MALETNGPTIPPETEAATQGSIPDILNDLSHLSDLKTDTVHGTTGFISNGMLLGFRVPTLSDDGPEDIKLFFISDGSAFRYEIGNNSVDIGGSNHTINNRSILPTIEDRWGLRNVQNFMKNPVYPDGFYFNIIKTIENYLYLRTKAQ